MYVQGGRLGRLILGDENNAGYLLHVNAPTRRCQRQRGRHDQQPILGEPWLEPP